MPIYPNNPFQGLFSGDTTTEKKKTATTVKKGIPENPFEGLFNKQPAPQTTNETRELDQYGLPKSTISAAPAKTAEPAKTETFWTKVAKTVLPKKLEVYFGLTEPAEPTIAERVKSGYAQGYAYEDLKKLQQEVEAEAGKKQTAGEVLKETKPEKYLPFVSAIPDIVSAYQTYQSAKRIENNEETMVDIYRLAKYKAETERDQTFGAKVVSVLTELPSFGAELLLTGGIFSAGKKATEKAITETLTKALGKTAGRIISKSAANIVGGTLQTIPARFTEITAGTIQNMIPDYQFEKSELGTLQPVMTGEGDDLWKAAAKSLSNQWVEVVSEHSGGIFDEILTPVKNQLMKVGILKAFLKANPTAKSSDFMKIVRRAGWNGVLQEMGEERIGELARGVLTQFGLSEDGWKLPTAEQLAVELVSFSIPGVMIGATNRGLSSGETGETKKPEVKNPAIEAEMVVGARDILAVNTGAVDTDPNAVRVLQDISRDYQEKMAESVFDVYDQEENNLASIKVIQYPDGKWGYSYELLPAENGILSDFNASKLLATKEEAVAVAKQEALQYAKEQINKVSDEAKADLAEITNQLNKLNPSLAVPIEVRKNIKEAEKPKTNEEQLIEELQTKIMSGDTEYLDKMREKAKGNKQLSEVLEGAIAEAQKKADQAGKEKKPSEKKREIKTAHDAALDLIRAYVERGDSLKDLQSGGMGAYGSDYGASIGGFVSGKAIGNNKVVVEKLHGKELDKPEIFSLSALYDEIKKEATETQKQKVEKAVKEKPKSIKEVAEETKILEPNVRRILGVGAKDGTFERVDKGVYVLKKDGKQLAYVETGDAVEVLPRLAKEGFKADMIFLDIPYKTPAVIGGNRGIKYEYITPEQFKIVVDAVKDIARADDTPVFYMYSQAKSGEKEMQKYNDTMTDAGFKAVARGEYTKLQKDGITRVRNMRGNIIEPEGIILFTKSGEAKMDNPDLNYKLIRPRGYQTEKPAEMVKALIEMSTKEGEVVLDPFAGSGVVPAEAVKAGREAVAIEKSENAVEENIKPRVEEAAKSNRAIILDEYRKSVLPELNTSELLIEVDGFVDKIRELDPKDEIDAIHIKHGAKYEATVSYPHSLGENGNQTTFDYANYPNAKEIHDDLIDTYKEFKIEVNKPLTAGIVAKSGRDENIEAAIDKVLKPAVKTEKTTTPRFAKPKAEIKIGKKVVPAHEIASKIMPKRASLPILSEFKVKDGRLTATDLEIALTLNSDLPDGMYRMVGKDAIKTDTDPAEFPIMPEVKGNVVLTALSDNIQQTLKEANISTAGSGSARFELTGVLFKIEDGQVVVASTDAYRLYMNRLRGKVSGSGSFILSSTDKLQKVITALGGKVEMSFEPSTDNTSGYVKFSGENGNAVVRMIEGEYPDFKQIINSYKKRYSLEKPRLMSALKELKPYFKEIGFNNEVRITFNDNKMTLVVEKEADEAHNKKAIKKEITIDIHGSREVDTAAGVYSDGVIVMPIKTDSETVISLNGNYLIDALNSLPDDAIYIYTTDSPTNQPSFFSNIGELATTEAKPATIKDFYEFSTPVEEARAKFRDLFSETEVGFIINNKLLEQDFAGQWSRTNRFGWKSINQKYRSLVELIEKDGKVSDRVLYHEAFHAYFNTFLSKSEREAALKVVKESIITKPARFLKDKKVYDTEDKQAEEWLADDFARYVANKQSVKYGGLRGLYEKILNRLNQWVRKSANLEQIYNDILGKVRNGVYSADPQTRGFARTKRRLDEAIKNNDRAELIEQLLTEIRSDKKIIAPSGYASVGADKLGSFEDLSAIKNKTAEEIKIFEEVKGLIEKYAKSIGEDYLPRNALGVYYPETTNVRIKGMNNLSVAAHEITHFLDFAYNITDQVMGIKGYAVDGKPIYESGTAKMRKEMTNLYEKYYPGGKRTHKLKKRMIEGFATLLEKYTEQPSSITAEFPTIVREFLTSEGKYYKPVMGDIIRDLRGIVATYQGLPALDKIGARVINDKVNVNKDSFLNFGEKLKTEIADNIYPIEVLAKKTGVHFTKSDPSLWVRQYNNSNALINNNLLGKRGYWGWRNGELVKLHDFNWNDLIKELKDDKTTDAFGYWLVARREYFAYKELDELKKKVDDLAQIIKEVGSEEAGQSLLSDYREAQKDYQDAKAILDKDGFTEIEVNDAYLLNKERFEEVAKKYDILVREDLNFLNDPEVGLVNNTEYNQLASQEGYASFKRYFYDEVVGEEQVGVGRVRFGSTKVSSMLKRTGSQKPIINPLMSALKNHAEITRKGLKQTIYNKMARVAIDNPDLGLFQRLQLKAVPDREGRFLYPQEKDANIIMARLGYKRVPILTDSTIKKTIDEVLDFHNINIFENLLLAGSRFFTKGTTGLFPGFALTNYAVDQVTAAAQTRENYIPLYSPLKKLTMALNSDNPQHAYYLEYMIMGGERQTFVGWQDLSPNELFNRMNKEREGILKVADLINSGMDIFAIPAKYSEIATRATEYVSARQSGKTPIVALEEAGRVTAPFHHIGRWGGGRIGQVYIKSIPFFNPAIQVLSQAAETLETKEGRQRYAFVTLAVTAASIAGVVAIMASGTDEQKQLYADLNPDELNKYIWYPNPNGKSLIKIRVPDQMAVFGTLINMAWSDKVFNSHYTAGEYFNAGMSWLPQQIDISSPTRMFMAWIPQLIKPGALTLAGVKDWPKIMPLESQMLQNRAPEYRYNEATSPVAKWLGKQFKLSPIKIDYLLTGYLGRAIGFLTGKPGIYNSFKSLSREYYFTSGRKIQTFYELKEKNDQDYEAWRNGREDFKLGERTAILKEKAKLKVINDLIGLYRDIDPDKQPEKAENLRTKILKKIDEL